MIRLFFASIVMFLLPYTLGFSQTLSYKEARLLMEMNNKKLQGLVEREKANEYEQKKTIGLRFPSLKLKGNYTYINDPVAISLNSQRNMIGKLLKMPKPEMLGNWEMVLQEQKFGSVFVEMQYPLFTGGKINVARKASKLKQAIKNKEITKEQNGLLTQLAVRYYQLQLAEKTVEIRKQVLKTSLQHLSNAEKLEKNGMIAGVERLQVATGVASAECELLVSQKNAALARTALAGVLGVEEMEDTPNSPLFISKKLKGIGYYQSKAVEYFPDIAKLFLQQQLAIQNVKAKKAAYIPDIAIVGKKNIVSQNLSVLEPDWFVGIGFSFNLFDGTKRRNELREAKSISNSIMFFKEQAIQDIRLLVKKHYLELEKQVATVESIEKDMQFAEELLRVREKSFAEGIGEATDVIDATLNLSIVQLKKQKALYEYDITLASLLEVCGESINFNYYIEE